VLLRSSGGLEPEFQSPPGSAGPDATPEHRVVADGTAVAVIPAALRAGRHTNSANFINTIERTASALGVQGDTLVARLVSGEVQVWSPVHGTGPSRIPERGGRPRTSTT